jgi:hypothetical protein
MLDQDASALAYSSAPLAPRQSNAPDNLSHTFHPVDQSKPATGIMNITKLGGQVRPRPPNNRCGIRARRVSGTAPDPEMIAISYSLSFLIEPTSEWIRSFAIITTTPIELCAALHDRMPGVLGRQNRPAWLGEEPADPPDVNVAQTGLRSRA